MKNEIIISQKQIESRIFTFRDNQVMLDRDLAEIYQVETKVLNQAVKRNINRFPEFFRFQLNDNERNELVTNCDRFEMLKHSSSNPFAFTEQGVAMLSAVLRSDFAVEVSIQIMNAFIAMRKFINVNSGLLQRMEGIEHKQIVTDQKLANQQYDLFQLIPFDKSHDRFLIIDSKEIYHLGASLKDLGKKWFAFSRMNLETIEELIRKVERVVET
mgnify:CR=1 FL=1